GAPAARVLLGADRSPVVGDVATRDDQIRDPQREAETDAQVARAPRPHFVDDALTRTGLSYDRAVSGEGQCLAELGVIEITDGVGIIIGAATREVVGGTCLKNYLGVVTVAICRIERRSQRTRAT